MTSLRETIKSIALVSLVIMALILSRFVLLDDTASTLETVKVVETESVNVAKYINPQSYYISFGGLSYTKVNNTELQQDLWDALRPVITNEIQSALSVDLIDMQTYVKAFTDKSMMLRFTVGLDLGTWLTIYDDQLNIPDSLVDIRPYEIVLRADSPDRLYIYDKSAGLYYVIRHEAVESPLNDLITQVSSSGFVEYRKISDRFSLVSTVPDSDQRFNYELLPYQYTDLTQGLRISNEVDTNPAAFDNSVSTIAKSVFGNRLDFVKRLKDVNDAIVLMYGYGDKALTVSQDGTVTMNQKFNSNLAQATDFKKSLAIAIGGLEQFGVVPEGLQLASVSVTDEDYRKYLFEFSYKLENTVVTQKSGGAQVTVKGGQITEIKKNVKIVQSRIYTNVDRMFSIDNCITLNYLEVSLYYLQDNDIYDATLNNIQYYFPIRSAIEHISLEYVQQDMTMMPVWRVVISGRTYIFNAYNGTMIQTYR